MSNADQLDSLGDSGFLLIRSANLFYLQRPQTHSFNFPRQLSKFPNTKRKDEYFVDRPGDAETVRVRLSTLSTRSLTVHLQYSTQLRGGDIIIAFVCTILAFMNFILTLVPDRWPIRQRFPGGSSATIITGDAYGEHTARASPNFGRSLGPHG